MIRLTFLLAIILINLFLNSCESNVIKNNYAVNVADLTPYKIVKDTKSDLPEVKIRNVIEKFISQRPTAANLNEFSMIEKFLVPKSKIFNIQKFQIGYLFQNSIKERLVLFEIKEVEKVGKKDDYKVFVKEKIDIKYPGGDFNINDFSSVYFVSIINEEPMITDVQDNGYAFDSEVKNKGLPIIAPENQKDDKFAMVSAATNGISQYLNVDYRNLDTDFKNVGCYFAYGSGLNNLLATVSERKEIIYSKKIIRKICMSEIISAQQNVEDGKVKILIRTETIEGNEKRISDIKSVITLKNFGVKTWYITSIDSLPYP